MTTFEQGDLVLGSAVFKSEDQIRPYITVGNRNHPFSNNEQIFIVITTTQFENSIKIEQSDFREGSLPKQSYASPWSVLTLKNQNIREKIGVFTDGFVEKVVSGLDNYTKIDSC
jgi:hypothetical protein